MGFFKKPELTATANGAVLESLKGDIELADEVLILHGLTKYLQTVTVPLSQLSSIAYGGIGLFHTVTITTTDGVVHERQVAGGRMRDVNEQFVALVRQRVGGVA